jgi:hypothetical protein
MGGHARPIGFSPVTQFRSIRLHALSVIFGVKVAGAGNVDFLTTPKATDVMVPTAKLDAAGTQVSIVGNNTCNISGCPEDILYVSS